MKFFYFLLLIAAGFSMIRYSLWYVQTLGIRSATAEKFFGPGGTYTFLKLFGVVVIVLAFWYLVEY